MAPSSLDPKFLNSTLGLLTVLDLNENQTKMENVEDTDMVIMEVPDTPDRLLDAREASNFGNMNENAVERCSNWVRKQRRLSAKNKRSLYPSRSFISAREELEQRSNPIINLTDSPSGSSNASPGLFTEKVFYGNNRAKLDGDTTFVGQDLVPGDIIQDTNRERSDFSVRPKRNSHFADRGKWIDLSSDTKQKTEQIVSKPLVVTRKQGQNRFVRNGFISPCNIARTMQSTCQSHTKNSPYVNQSKAEKVIFNCETPSSEINNISSTSEVKWDERAERMKGKRVIEELTPRKEYDRGSIHWSSRSPINLMEEATGIEDASRAIEFEGNGGWRRTHNHSKPSFSMGEGGCVSKRNGGTEQLLCQNSFENSNCAPEVNSRCETDFIEVKEPDLAHGPTSLEPERGRDNARRARANRHFKRQRKHAFGHGKHGECSTSTFDDSEVVSFPLSREPLEARSARMGGIRRRGTSGPVIEIDELSPELIRTRPQIPNRRVEDNSAARARQLEADELLARQLQEQFFQETQGVSGGEIDASIAWGLQEEENLRRASSVHRQRVHSRESSISHLYRQYPSEFVQNSSAHWGRRRRDLTSARMTQWQNSFRTDSRSMSSSSRGRGFQFPSSMDVEMRIHILEALEDAVGDNIDMTNHLFHTQRDFNEGDYEMLLALDENNCQNAGASTHQINGLPQSVVQIDNFEEACAVCLDTPAHGDTIRHLPCLHKFHKDCIDPWLRRRPTCPVCKSFIT